MLTLTDGGDLHMTAFEFLVAFVGILIGLAIADLATSLHRLLRARGRVKWDWATPIAAIVVAIQVMAQFWVFWFSRSAETYTFTSVSALAVVLALVFLLASAVLPDEVPESGLDLRIFYDANRRYFWGLMAVYIAVVTFQQADVFLAPQGRMLLVLNLVGVALATTLAIARWRWLHAVGLAVFLAVQISRYFAWTTVTEL